MAEVLMHVYPSEELRWTRHFEDELRYRQAEQALQQAVGYLTYHASSWEQIAARLQADQNAAISAFESWAKCADARCQKSGNVCSIELLILPGVACAPRSDVPSDIKGTFSSRTGLAKTFFNDAVETVWARQFGFDSLRDPIDAIVREARAREDSYLLELDRVVTCKPSQGGQASRWTSKAVILCIKKDKRDRIVMLSALAPTRGGVVEVSCTGLGGDVIAEIPSASNATCFQLRQQLAEQLGSHVERLKLVLPSGKLVKRKQDNSALSEVLMLPVAAF